jgi:hypothetical protein
MRVHRAFLFLFLANVVGVASLHAGEAPQEAIPNWPAPPYWMPTKAIERSTTPQAAESRLQPEAVVAVPTAPLAFTGIPPCRLADTRGNEFTGAYGPPVLMPGSPRSFTLTGQCGIPGNAEAVSLNVTVTNTQGPGHIVIYPQGGAFPPVATLIYVAGQTIANAAVISLGTSGGITFVAAVSGTDLIVDTNGYYAPQTVVNTLNGLSGAVALAAGTDVSITPSSSTLTIAVDATPSNTANTIVRRDGSGDFSAGTVTLSGNLVLPFPNTASAGTVFQGGTRLLYTLGPSSASVFLGPFAGNFTINGTGNTAVGDSALRSDTIGGGNTATGASALQANTTGNFNTADGYAALTSNVGGSSNTAVGAGALAFSTGSGNIGIGNGGGGALTTGSNNIAIFAPGLAAESNTIRIGSQGTQTSTFIAGISGAAVTGTAVVVNSNGQLGVAPSSRSFKEDICDMRESSDGLLKLRPVSFRYKPEYDGSGLRQYGLIAEEVAEVYPDLVVYDGDGQPATVRYDQLVPILVNEVQKDRKTIDRQGMEISDLKARLERLETTIATARTRRDCD